MSKIELSVLESLQYAQEMAYLDGLSAGVKLATDHAKQLSLEKIIGSRKPAPQPTQPESTEVRNDTNAGSE